MYEKLCRECGMKFFAARIQSKYCCDACREAGNRRNVRAASERHRRKKRREKIQGLTMAQINDMARKSGLTYGQYVAMHSQ